MPKNKTKSEILIELEQAHKRIAELETVGKTTGHSVEVDIAERTQTEEVQRERDERYQLLFEGMTQGVVFQDGEGRLLHANPAAEKIMGLTLEEMRGQKAIDPDWPIIQQDGSALPADEHPSMRVLRDGQPVNNIVIGVFNPQKKIYIWLNINAFPRFNNGDSRPYQVFTIFEDITAHKKIELELRESEKQLRSMLEISQAMSASLEMDTVLQKIIENATGLLQLDSGAIYTLEDDQLFLEATTPPLPPGFPDELRRANVTDHPHIQTAISSGSAVVLADTKTAELSNAEKMAAEARGLRSIMYVPLIISEKAIGVFIVASVNRLRTFREEEIAMYSGFSGQAAQTIVNTRLYNSEREYAAKLEMQIAERMQAEERLHYSEERLSQIADNVGEVVWMFDNREQKLVYLNAAYEKIWGRSIQETYQNSQNYIDAIHPEDRGIMFAALERQGQGERTEMEYRVVHSNGSIYWISDRSFPIYGEDGTLIRTTGIATDITERKRAEYDLHESERKYHDLINGMNDTVWVIDTDMSFLDLNDAAVKMLGYSRNELLLMKVSDIDDAIEPEQIQALINRLNEEKLQVFETRHKAKNGRVIPVEVSSSLVSYMGRTVIMSIARDITERKQFESALVSSEKKLKSLVDSQTHFVIRVNMQGNYTYWNSRFEKEFGWIYQTSDFRNTPVMTAVCPHHHERVREVVEKCIFQPGQVFSVEIDKPARDGGVRTTLWEFVCLTDENNQPVEIQCMGIEITERRLAEEALRINEERLRTVADFTYDMEFWMDENKTLLYMSPSCQRITGYEREQLQKDPSLLQSMVHPDDRSAFEKHSIEEFDLPDSCSLDFRIVTASGEVRWISHTCQAVTGANGKFRGRRVSHRDITEPRHTLQELRASEEKYRGLVKSLSTAISVLDFSGNFLYLNDTAAEDFASTPQEVIGRNMRDLFPEPFASAQMTYVQRVFKTDQEIEYEAQSMVKGGLRWFRVSFQPLHDENGEVKQVLINATDIHDLKAAQQELQELNRTLEEKVAQRTTEVQDLYENAPTGYHSIDAEGKFVMVNQTELNRLGYTREEMIGHAAADFITEATREAFQESFLLLIQRGWVKDVELEFARKDGSALPILLNATAVYDEAGNFIVTRSTIFDNTERKQAENELKRNINFTSALLNAVPTPVFYKDKEGRYLGCNHAFVELMGKTPEEIRGKLPHEIWETTQADLYRQKDLELMQANQRQFYEAVITDKNGVVRPVIFVKDLFYDEDGNVAGLVGAFIDISERKQAENAIRESEATYRALFENSNDGIFLMSSTGEELRANQRALDMVGYTLEEYLTLGHINQNPFTSEADQRKDADDKLDALLRGETVPLYERIFTAKDGHKVPVEINLSPVRDANGTIIMVQSVVRDIAERKAAEEALRSINKELERALLVKDEFLANMSHELRTPLNGILGFSEILLSGQFGSLSERQHKYVSSIESSGKHLLGLINDLLDLAKIEAGKLDVTLENVVISELCQSSLMFVKQIALNKSIQLSFEQDMTYPYLIADQRRLKQILVNLLSNAVKFTPEHGKVTLRVIADPVKDCVDFAVEDTGIGISQEDLLRLFKPFTQVDSSLTRQHEGTGLGLALVQKLAELHGGGITVQSEVGKGSTFTVCIPGRNMISLEEQKEKMIIPEPVVSTRQGGARFGKILLAEDTESNIVILGDYLEHQGYQLIYAKNGQEALEKAKETLPDLILMDIQMPVMDGLEATRRLRADPRFATLPIIALTALAMTGDRERCLEAGATEYVSKPTNLKRLSEMIASLINMER